VDKGRNLPTRRAETNNELAESLADNVFFGSVVIVVVSLMQYG
jgi:hypothetical protein